MHVTLSRAADEPVVDDGRTTPGSVPLYVAGFLVTLSALLSMRLLLDEDPGFISLIIGLSAIGFVVSFLVRRQGVNAYSIEIPAAAICVLLAVAATGDRGIPFLAPAGLEGDRAKTLAVVLTWITVFRSYTLITDGSLLFSCVMSIAIMGLVGTMTADPNLTRYYSLFVLSAAFMMVHETFLSARRRQADARRLRQSKMFFRQIQVAALCAVGALLLAIPFSVPLQGLGSLLSFTPTTPGTVSKNQTNVNVRRISISEQQAISVGTGPVSLSDQEVMRVKASQGSYWRGATFNIYTGRGWNSSLNDQLTLLLPDTSGRAGGDIFNEPQVGQSAYVFTVPANTLSAVGENSYLLTQQVRFVGNGIFQDIYAAPEIRSLTMAEERAQL